MKRFLAILVITVFLFPLSAFAQDQDKDLVMRRDLVQERVLRIQAELSLIKIQYQSGVEALQAYGKELETLNKALSPKPKAEKPKKEKSKK